MISLGRENISKDDKNKSIISIKSKPIPINRSKTNLYFENESYEVSTSIFNPHNSSPPDNWQIRLQNRLAQFTSDSVIYSKVRVF